jgi:hypothetical protein
VSAAPGGRDGALDVARIADPGTSARLARPSDAVAAAGTATPPHVSAPAGAALASLSAATTVLRPGVEWQCQRARDGEGKDEWGLLHESRLRCAAALAAAELQRSC